MSRQEAEVGAAALGLMAGVAIQFSTDAIADPLTIGVAVVAGPLPKANAVCPIGSATRRETQW